MGAAGFNQRPLRCEAGSRLVVRVEKARKRSEQAQRRQEVGWKAANATDERLFLSDPGRARIFVSVAASAHLSEDALHDLIALALGGSADGVEQSFKKLVAPAAGAYQKIA